MYGNINEKKLTQKDMTLTCDNIRQEFQQEIDIEHRRVNVDSAKKKAVLFHYDYEGFRQMVLGANLYNIKSKELENFGFAERKNDKVLNSLMNTYRPTEEEILEFEITIKSIQCNNFRDFRSLFQKKYTNPMVEESFIECMNILQAQTKENIKKIFSIDFQINYFFQILQVFTYSLNQKNESNHICFIIGFLEELSQIRDIMLQIKKFLKKSEVEELKGFLLLLQSKIGLEYDGIQLNDKFHKTVNEIMHQYI